MVMKYLMPALALCLLAAPSFAAQQCYSPNEAQAEELLRLHSELMVITVTCREDSRGTSLVPAYTTFTHEHVGAIRDAEQILIAYYHKVFGDKGVEELDKLRTRLGNEFGAKIAALSAPIFCQMYRDKVQQMCGAGLTEIQTEIDRLAADSKPYAAMCAPLAKSP